MIREPRATNWGVVATYLLCMLLIAGFWTGFYFVIHALT